MWGIAAFLFGMGFGIATAAIYMAEVLSVRRSRPAKLPPATAWRIARARRATRLHIPAPEADRG